MGRVGKRLRAYTHGIIWTASLDPSTPHWEIKALDVARLKTTLGPDLVTRFAQLFVAADKLAMMDEVLKASESNPKSARGVRNRVCATAAAVSALYEGAEAIKGLRSLRVAAVVPTSRHWRALVPVAARWLGAFKSLRNQASAHADFNMIRAELHKVAKDGTPLVLMAANGDRLIDRSLIMGWELVLGGLRRGMTSMRYRRLIAALRNDPVTVARSAGLLFLEVLAAKGVGLPMTHALVVANQQGSRGTRRLAKGEP